MKDVWEGGISGFEVDVLEGFGDVVGMEWKVVKRVLYLVGMFELMEIDFLLGVDVGYVVVKIKWKLLDLMKE